MRQQLLDLNEIQQIDLGIREIERRSEAIPARLRELESTIATSRSELSKLTEQRDALVKESKTLEASVHAESLKIKKWDVRLNDIRNQREYLALSREIEGGKRQNRDHDERIAELNVQLKQLNEQIEKLHDTVAETEVDCDAERARVQAELAGITGKLNSEKARKEALIGKVPGSLFRKYESIRQKRLGIGLIAVIDGNCQGCNMKLPPQLYIILQKVQTIEQCPSCQRIMYWSRILEKDGETQKEGAGASL